MNPTQKFKDSDFMERLNPASRMEQLKFFFLANMKYYVYLVIGLIFLAATVITYRYYVSPSMNKKFVENREFMPEGVDWNSAEIYIFYADWCPHCKTAAPHWDEIIRTYDGKTINRINIEFHKVNCTESDSAECAPLLNKFKIEGYPTVKMVLGDEVIDFDANPTVQNLTQFITTVIGSPPSYLDKKAESSDDETFGKKQIIKTDGDGNEY